MRKAVHAQRGHSESAIDKVQRAGVQGAQAGHEGSVPALSQKGVTRLSIERAHFDIKDYLWSGTIGVVASADQRGVVIFIAYFLMISGRTFRRKLVKIAGPTFTCRRLAVRVLDEITEQMCRRASHGRRRATHSTRARTAELPNLAILEAHTGAPDLVFLAVAGFDLVPDHGAAKSAYAGGYVMPRAAGHLMANHGAHHGTDHGAGA